jgi:pimeloyl-ACP methyl ester carboxylesterase
MTPIALRLLGSAASTVDRAFVAALELRNRRARLRSDALSHAERMAGLGRVCEIYGAKNLIADPEAFFPVPARVAPNGRRLRVLPWGGESVELSWPSAFRPFDSGASAAYMANVSNRTAYARLYGGNRGRPVVVLIHGYMSGQWAVEERAWPIRWLNQIGLDVALMVLPFHGVRAHPGGGAPPFPGGNPTVTNEGFRQVVTDLRSLTGILRDRGASKIGVMGMSLGGYSTALFAAVQSDLAFAVPLIPLVSIADFARDQGRLGTGQQAALQHAALETANGVVSPLARPSLVPKERTLIVAAEDDRVTPIAQAERLATHLDVPLLRLHGGHLLQTWRTPAFRAIREMLQRNVVI